MAQVEPEAGSPGVTQRTGVVRDVVGHSGHSRPTLGECKLSLECEVFLDLLLQGVSSDEHFPQPSTAVG